MNHPSSLAGRSSQNESAVTATKTPALLAEISRASDLANEIHDSISGLINHLETVRNIPPAVPNDANKEAPQPNNLAGRLRNTNERLCMALSRISNLRNELDV